MTDKKVITAKAFKERFGRAPTRDDLQRVNCDYVGEAGHYQCGVCSKHEKPRFMCGCMFRIEGDSAS